MKIHEYQAKAILKKYGVTVPRGSMATSREEAESVAKELFDSGSSGVVVKAQIHAGGRGKGGGVKIAKSVDEAGDLAAKMLGMKLVTHQTGPEGRIVRRLLIEETLPIAQDCVQPRTQREADCSSGAVPDQPLQGLSRHRRFAARDQSFHYHD